MKKKNFYNKKILIEENFRKKRKEKKNLKKGNFIKNINDDNNEINEKKFELRKISLDSELNELPLNLKKNSLNSLNSNKRRKTELTFNEMSENLKKNLSPKVLGNFNKFFHKKNIELVNIKKY